MVRLRGHLPIPPIAARVVDTSWIQPLGVTVY